MQSWATSGDSTVASDFALLGFLGTVTTGVEKRFRQAKPVALARSGSQRPHRTGPMLSGGAGAAMSRVSSIRNKVTSKLTLLPTPPKCPPTSLPALCGLQNWSRQPKS